MKEVFEKIMKNISEHKSDINDNITWKLYEGENIRDYKEYHKDDHSELIRVIEISNNHIVVFTIGMTKYGEGVDRKEYEDSFYFDLIKYMVVAGIMLNYNEKVKLSKIES